RRRPTEARIQLEAEPIRLPSRRESHCTLQPVLARANAARVDREFMLHVRGVLAAPCGRGRSFFVEMPCGPRARGELERGRRVALRQDRSDRTATIEGVARVRFAESAHRALELFERDHRSLRARAIQIRLP